MSYPIYSLPYKSQKSKNEKVSNIKKKNNNPNDEVKYNLVIIITLVNLKIKISKY